MKLRVAGFVPESIVDGPGIRLTIFAQGCSHRCPGCHNPESQDPLGGEDMEVGELLKRIRAARSIIDGVTFSGGEPFEQAAPLAALTAELPTIGLNLVLYSGYTFEELLEMSKKDLNVYRLLKGGQILIDGPFRLAERNLALPYRGSGNQRILDLSRSLASGKPVLWQRKNVILANAFVK